MSGPAAGSTRPSCAIRPGSPSRIRRMPSWPTRWRSRASSRPWRPATRSARPTGSTTGSWPRSPLEPAPRLVVRRRVGRARRLVGAFLVAVPRRLAGRHDRRPAHSRSAPRPWPSSCSSLLAGGALTTVAAVGVGAFLQGNGQATPSLRPGSDGRTDHVGRPPSHPSRPRPSDSPEPSESPSRRRRPRRPDATETPKSARPRGRPRPLAPTRTPRPTETPHAEDTQEPGETPDPTGTDDHGGGGGGGGGPGPG